MINRIFFMFHPVCWGMHGDEAPPERDEVAWTACLNWERRANRRQKEFMSSMKPDEALVIFPISRSRPMLELEEHAREALGARCVIMSNEVAVGNPPACWEGVDDPIRRFLDDGLEGREEWLKDVPGEVRTEVEAEVEQACGSLGYGWNLSALKVVYNSRLFAMDVQRGFEEQGLRYDPASVESESFGEGFEQCAMTWKAMTVPYMGLAKPAYNIFELSVTGAQFLVKARLEERVKLGEEIQLFLWEGEDGRPIGLYARAWCRLSDPQYCACVPCAGGSFEVHNILKKVWPGEDAPLRVEDGCLRVPVLNAIRRDDTDDSFYLMGHGIPFAEFRECLVNARIEEVGL